MAIQLYLVHILTINSNKRIDVIQQFPPSMRKFLNSTLIDILPISLRSLLLRNTTSHYLASSMAATTATTAPTPPTPTLTTTISTPTSPNDTILTSHKKNAVLNKNKPPPLTMKDLILDKYIDNLYVKNTLHTIWKVMDMLYIKYFNLSLFIQISSIIFG